MPTEKAERDIESLEQIFQVVSEAPVLRQDELIAELCPDSESRQLMRKLLDADSSDGMVIDRVLFPAPVEMSLGDQIGPYKLLQKIGEGGMGVVYMAEQLTPVRRNVALKIIKPGIDSKEVLARFSAERQALSMLDHPNIAKVLDVGATETGRPYFVMELVKGRSITQYCRERRLSLHDKLVALTSVCHAIQHAHQKGIIHRDLKPSNVLVAEYDGRPVAKVIDFGVAKAVENPLTEITLFTGFGQIVGTLEYMSPEQSRMNQLDVDVRSDVYSLGVICYELITGSTPISKTRLRTAAWDEMLRIIREEDPPSPSQRLSDWASSDHDAPPRPGQTSGSQAERKSLSLLVRGELDWIVMKALEKDRSRRYASPGEFAEDIARYLSGDMVSACPPSLIYRCQKTFKRHRLAFLTSGLVAVSLILGLAGTTWQAWRATEAESIAKVERDLAQEQARKAAEATEVAQREAQRFRVMDEFLQTDLLGLEKGTTLLLPNQVGDPDVTLSELLDRARDRLSNPDGPYQNRPNNRRELMLWLVRSYCSISRFEDATILLEQVVDDYKNTNGEQSRETLQYVAILAQLYVQQYRWWEALDSYQEAFDGRLRLYGDEHPITLNSRENVANTFRVLGLYEQAAVHYRYRLELEQRSDDSSLIAAYQLRLGSALGRLGQTAEAEQLLRRAIVSLRQQNAPQELQNALSELGLLMLRNEKYSEAPDIFAEAYERSRESDDEDKQFQRQLTYAVACLLAPSRQALKDPLSAIDESLANVLQQPPVVTAVAMDDLRLLARCLQLKGHPEQAAQLLQRALAVLNRYSFHGTRRSTTLADLAAIARSRNEHLKSKQLLLQAVEYLADTETYPSHYNQTPEYKASKEALSNTLVGRLVQVHRELGDQAGAEVWQEKLK